VAYTFSLLKNFKPKTKTAIQAGYIVIKPCTEGSYDPNINLAKTVNDWKIKRKVRPAFKKGTANNGKIKMYPQKVFNVGNHKSKYIPKA